MIVNIDDYSIAELIEMKFGLKKGQEFKLIADPILHKYYAVKADEDDITYCFKDGQLLHKNEVDYDHWSEWYGFNEKQLELIVSGIYTPVSIDKWNEIQESKKRQFELDEQYKRNAVKKYLKDYADNKGWKHIKILDEKDGFDDFYLLIAYTDETMTAEIKDPDNGMMMFFNKMIIRIIKKCLMQNFIQMCVVRTKRFQKLLCITKLRNRTNKYNLGRLIKM